ncbi:MAG: glutathione S-transferase, partial [Pseudomonadota bacterium]
MADMAILPFVRQFAMIDKARFDREASAQVSGWLERFLASDRFQAIMPKLPKWQAGDPVTLFPFDRG